MLNSVFFFFPLGESCNQSAVTILLFVLAIKTKKQNKKKSCEKTQTYPPDKKLQWQKCVSVCSSATPVYNEYETTESFRNQVRINHMEAKLCSILGFFCLNVAFLIPENNQRQLFFF